MDQLVSIIVPIYNAEKTLDKCIFSLRMQTHKRIEIILVNDGSKDGSLSICKLHEKKDHRICVIDKPNEGVSSARNTGLNVANGEFIMFCDSDDWAEPDWCEELLSHYERNCLVMCGHFVEGEQHFIPHEIKSIDIYSRFERKDFYKLKLFNFNAPWNKIFAAEIINKYNLRFDERITNGEDFLFILQYLDKLSGDILLLNKCVFHYEWPREQSLSCKVSDSYYEQCCILSNKIFALAARIGLEDERGKKQLSTDFFNEFQKSLVSILYDGEMNLKEKINKMNIIMSTKEYQKCAAEANISTNMVYSFLSRRKNGLGLWLWHQIRK